MSKNTPRAPRLQEDLDYLWSRTKPSSPPASAPAFDPAALSELLPADVAMIYEEHGFTHLFGGRMQLCDPKDMAPVVTAIFEGDPDLIPEETHILAYSAFGHLVFWNDTHWKGEVSLLDGLVSCRGLLYPEKKRNQINDIIGQFTGFEQIDADWEGDDGKPLFAASRKKLGALDYGECFGFAPALALGGAPSLETIQRYPAVEHFVLLAQLQPMKLRDYLSRPMRDVRLIGSHAGTP